MPSKTYSGIRPVRSGEFEVWWKGERLTQTWSRDRAGEIYRKLKRQEAGSEASGKQ